MRYIMRCAVVGCWLFASIGFAGEPATLPTVEVSKEKAKAKVKVKVDPRAAFHFDDAKKGWVVVRWSDAAALSAAAGEDKTEGAQALKLTVTKPKTGKTAIRTMLPKLNLADYDGFVIDVKLANAKSYPVLLTAAFSLGRKGRWVESVPVQLKPGWNRDVRFAFATGKWKSAATTWHYQASPRRQGSPKSLTLLVHGLDYQEAVIFDNLRLTPSPVQQQRVNPQPRETTDLTRADVIRAHALNTLTEYAADLTAQNRAAEATALQALIKQAAAAPLAAIKMPILPLLIEVTAKEKLRLEGKSISAAKLVAALKAQPDKARAVIIKASSKARYTIVTSLLDACKKTGMTNVSIAVEKKAAKEKKTTKLPALKPEK